MPGVVLPISALTPRTCDLDGAGAGRRLDRAVQRPEDIIEARERIGDRARIIAKLEKPSAVERLDEIIAQADALMVARATWANCRPNRCPLSRSVPRVPPRRQAGDRRHADAGIHDRKPRAPRAEASDVATAIYDGADAVMLSAESATGKQHPQAAVAMMSRIIEGTEADPQYRQLIDASHSPPCRVSDTAQAVCCAMRHAAALLKAAAIVCFTSSGATSLRGARTAEAPVLSLTPSLAAARRLTLVWGVHSVHVDDVADIAQSTAWPAPWRRRSASAAPDRRWRSSPACLRQGRHHQSAAHRHRLKNQI